MAVDMTWLIALVGHPEWLVVTAAALGIGAVLGLLGGGGSVLTVPLLVYGVGIAPKTAIATSLVVVGGTSLIAMLQHARRGNVRWSTGWIFGLAGMSGAFGGGRMAEIIPAQVLLLLFAAVMFATAVAMLRGRRQSAGAAIGAPQPLPVFRIMFDGACVGGITGLVGAGGGFVIVPALTLLGAVPMHAAVGTSLLVLSVQSGAALAGYLNHVQINWPLAVGVTGLAVLGSVLGAALAPLLPARQLRRVFGVVVMGIAVYVVYREVDRAMLQALFVVHAEFWAGVLTVVGAALLVRVTQRLRVALEHVRLPLLHQPQPATGAKLVGAKQR